MIHRLQRTILGFLTGEETIARQPLLVDFSQHRPWAHRQVYHFPGLPLVFST